MLLKHQRKVRIWECHSGIRPPNNTQAAFAELVNKASLSHDIATQNTNRGQVARSRPASGEHIVSTCLDAVRGQPSGNCCPALAAVVSDIHHPLARTLQLLHSRQGAWNRVCAVEQHPVLVQHERVKVTSLQPRPCCWCSCMRHEATPAPRRAGALQAAGHAGTPRQFACPRADHGAGRVLFGHRTRAGPHLATPGWRVCEPASGRGRTRRARLAGARCSHRPGGCCGA